MFSDPSFESVSYLSHEMVILNLTLRHLSQSKTLNLKMSTLEEEISTNIPFDYTLIFIYRIHKVSLIKEKDIGSCNYIYIRKWSSFEISRINCNIFTIK